MDKETAEKIVNGRNIMALKEGMNENRRRINGFNDEIKQLNNRITMLEGDLAQVKAMVTMLLQRTTGSGATSQ